MKSEHEWLAILKRWKTSPLPQHEFCRAEGIAYSQFSKKRATIMNDAKGMYIGGLQKRAPFTFLPIETPQAFW